jgi:hemolysin activation/secretion protein
MSCGGYEFLRLSAVLVSLAGTTTLCGPVASAQTAAEAATSVPVEAQPVPQAETGQAETGGESSGVPAQFTVEAIDVVGATVLTADEIENAVYRYTGERRSTADLEAARKALQDLYTAKGYEAAVVDLPPQDNARFAAGFIQIRVSEAPIGEVRVVGTKFHSADGVRAQLPAVEAGKPLNLAALQKQLVEANRIPDRTVSPAFKPSKTEGAIDIELKVKDTFPVHGSLELNNDNSPNTTRLRLSGALRYTNLWGAGHTVSGSYIVAPQNRKDIEVFSGSYSAPLLGTPWSLLVSGYKSNSNIAALGGTNVLGNGYQVGVRAIYRMSSEKADQSFSIGFDFKDFKQDIFVANAAASKAPIRYIPLALGYAYSRPGEKGQLDINLDATVGLRVIKRVDLCPLRDDNNICSKPEQEFSLRTKDAQENFVHINLDASYRRLIADDVSLIFRVAGQYADGPLISNEQFGLGGESTVRGYFQSEAVGDNGINSSVQLDGPSLAGSLPDFVGELRPFGFVDFGIVGVVDPLADVRSRFILGSAGGGVRLRLFKHLVGGLTVGVPFTTLTDSKRGTARITFTARGEF